MLSLPPVTLHRCAELEAELSAAVSNAAAAAASHQQELARLHTALHHHQHLQAEAEGDQQSAATQLEEAKSRAAAARQQVAAATQALQQLQQLLGNQLGQLVPKYLNQQLLAGIQKQAVAGGPSGEVDSQGARQPVCWRWEQLCTAKVEEVQERALELAASLQQQQQQEEGNEQQGGAGDVGQMAAQMGAGVAAAVPAVEWGLLQLLLSWRRCEEELEAAQRWV